MTAPERSDPHGRRNPTNAHRANDFATKREVVVAIDNAVHRALLLHLAEHHRAPWWRRALIKLRRRRGRRA